jgi:Fic family protein
MTESSDRYTPRSYDSICDFREWAGLRVDTTVFDRLAKRMRLAQEAEGGRDIQWAQDRILRASAFETGAVEDLYAEGATYSVAMEVEGWENDLANSGDGAEQHFEDQLAAYVVVRDIATKVNARPLLEVDVRELHRIATRSQHTYPVQTPNGVQQQTFVSGSYKTNPNRVINRAGTVVHYAPVEDVAPEMGRLIATMRTEAFTEAHPVIQSAYAHWAMAHIHPFSDGNGRMARVIGSIPLLKHYGIPLVVFAGRKRLYLQALESADSHEHQEMVDYVASRTSETYSWLAELLEGAHAGDAADASLDDIAHLLDTQAGRLETSKEAAERLKKTMVGALKREGAERFNGTKIESKVLAIDSYVTPKHLQRGTTVTGGYQAIDGEVRMMLSVDEVAQHHTSTSIQFGYTDVPGQPPLVVWHDLGSDDLYFSLEDCSPDLSVGADLRLRNLASTVTAHVTKSFKNNLAGIFKQHGRLPSHDA